MYDGPIMDPEAPKEGRYTRIFQLLPDGVLVARADDGMVMDVNRAFEELTGYGPEAIVGKPVLTMVSFLDPDLWHRIWDEFRRNGEVCGLRTRFLRQDGRIAFVLISMRCVEIDGLSCCIATIHESSGSAITETEDQGCRGESFHQMGNPLLPDVEIDQEDLGDLVDFQAFQQLMNSFYQATGIATAITDLNGNVRVATGWQDICIRFHRLHPETLVNCKESDTCLSATVKEGEYALYKCKNGLWDLVTPIVVGGRHIANFFLGQFFFDDEVPDYDFFRKQAERYSFDTGEYLAALDRVPRWSRELVESVLKFNSRLAMLISRLSIGNIRLTRALAEQKRVENEMRAVIEEKEVLLKEVHHRVKNNLQIISSLLDLQSDYLGDEQSRAIIRESKNRISSMALIHQKLYQSESFAFVNFREYIEELVTDLFATYARDPHLIQLNVDVGDVTLGMDEAIPCGLIINELVSNALKYAFPDDRRGEIAISFVVDEDDWITLKVSDNGIGFPPALDPWRTETLGLQLVRLLVRQLQGEISLAQQGGSTFSIRFWGRRARK